jgi:hypothetical protein
MSNQLPLDKLELAHALVSQSDIFISGKLNVIGGSLG